MRQYEHTNSKGVTFYLMKADVELISGRLQTIYYFARNPKQSKGEQTELPADRKVIENPRNGFLTCVKEKQRI